MKSTSSNYKMSFNLVAYTMRAYSVLRRAFPENLLISQLLSKPLLSAESAHLSEDAAIPC